jgi:hypothetical protein
MDELVVIPSGSVLRGGRSIAVPAFEIQQRLVTNRSYFGFVRTSGREPPPSWPQGRPSEETLDHPVVGVAHSDAAAYASDRGMRLATEAEWLRATCGPVERERPAAEASTKPPPRNDRSIFGVEQLLRVWEWTADAHPERGHVVRGGRWRNRETEAALSHRSFDDGPAADIGFRCVRSGVRSYSAAFDDHADRWPVKRTASERAWFQHLFSSEMGRVAYIEQQLARCTDLSVAKQGEDHWHLMRQRADPEDTDDDDPFSAGYTLKVLSPTRLFLSFGNYCAGAPHRRWWTSGTQGALIDLNAIATFVSDLAEYVMNIVKSNGPNGCSPT